MSSKLEEELKDKEYRDAFVAASVRNGVAFQIRAMRESREWDQKKLASKMGNEKLQPIISRYENPDYGRYSMGTLLELAKAFDVGLIVKFAPFSEMIQRDESLDTASLDVQSYAKELLSEAKPPENFAAVPEIRALVINPQPLLPVGLFGFGQRPDLRWWSWPYPSTEASAIPTTPGVVSQQPLQPQPKLLGDLLHGSVRA